LYLVFLFQKKTVGMLERIYGTAVANRYVAISTSSGIYSGLAPPQYNNHSAPNTYVQQVMSPGALNTQSKHIETAKS